MGHSRDIGEIAFAPLASLAGATSSCRLIFGRRWVLDVASRERRDPDGLSQCRGAYDRRSDRLSTIRRVPLGSSDGGSGGGGRGDGGEDQSRRWLWQCHHGSPLQRRQLEQIGGGRVGRSEVPAEITVVAVDTCAERAKPRGIPSAGRLRDRPGYTRYR